jgi:hypothetical protein
MEAFTNAVRTTNMGGTQGNAIYIMTCTLTLDGVRLVTDKTTACGRQDSELDWPGARYVFSRVGKFSLSLRRCGSKGESIPT